MTTVTLMRLAARIKGLPSVDQSPALPSKRALQTSILTAWQQRSQPIRVVNADRATTATLIFCHGLGDTGEGWSQAFRAEVAPQLPWIKFLFPTALSIPVSLNMGMSMPAWYDIESLDRTRFTEKAPGIWDSVLFLQLLADIEADDYLSGKSERVALGGFSQGAALTLCATHTFERRLGGAVALSGYFTARSETEEHWQEKNSDTPLFVAHGMQDPVVPYSVGKESFDAMVKVKQNRQPPSNPILLYSQFESFRMAHESCSDEMKLLVEFLKKVLPQ